MLEAMIGLCLTLTIVVGGKTLMLWMAALPVIGIFANWYMGMVGTISDETVANLIYGGMAMQIIILPWSALVYGPSLVRRIMAWTRGEVPGVN